MTIIFTEHEAYLDDRETTIAILTEHSSQKSPNFYKIYLYLSQIPKHY